MTPTARVAFDAFFLPVGDGARFCIHHAPAGPARAAVLHVHAWTEEMNKSRRMSALAARALLPAGDHARMVLIGEEHFIPGRQVDAEDQGLKRLGGAAGDGDFLRIAAELARKLPAHRFNPWL